MLDRRAFLGAGIAGTAALTFSSVWSQQATPNFGPPTLPATGVKRVNLVRATPPLDIKLVLDR